MTILEDVAQKEGKHQIKNEYWKSQNISVKRYPLPVGDYVEMNEKIEDVIDRKRKRGIDLKKMDLLGTFDISVDTKESLSELYQNLVQSHDRFRDELKLAQNNGIQLYILVENKEGIDEIEKLSLWNNPRLFMWMRSLRKSFTEIQKKLYRHDNACAFLEKRDAPIPDDAESVRIEYFKALKKVDIDEIYTYMKKIGVKFKKHPVDNNSLINTIFTMQEKYGVKFIFCSPEEAGRIVIELLKNK